MLLLDEPTRGVDIATKAEIYRIIGELASAGLGVLVVSSELEELAHICTRVLVMREGEIVAEVDGKDARSSRCSATPSRRRIHPISSRRLYEHGHRNAAERGSQRWASA